MRLKIIFASIVLGLAIYGCSKKFDNHDQTTDSNITINLYQAISQTTNTTIFSGYLQKTGFDKLLAGSKTYTVWVPTDAALATMDAGIVVDSAKLSQFVGNHITNQSYTVGGADQRIQMLNGKYIIMSGWKFDSANITAPNQYAKNGLYHVIDKFIPRTNSIWEFINATTAAPLMTSYLKSLNYNLFDSTRAIQTGVDPITGAPIYQTGTGLVPKNTFLNGRPSRGIPAVMDVSDESNQYTMIVLTDNSFTTELNKLTPWFKTGTVDSTNNISSAYLIKDLAFQGSFSPSELKDTMVSQYGIKVPINKANIVSSIKTSNGWVYVMNQVNFTLANKFPSIIIQGENPSGFSSTSSSLRNGTLYRIHTNPLTGATFNDLFIINANLPAFWVNYRVPNIPSMRYNAYWVAVNDYQAGTWTQKLTVDSVNNPTLYAYKIIDSSYKMSTYKEVLLGTPTTPITVSTYRTLNLFVVGPATASSTSGAQLSLDYIRLEPAF